MYLMRTTIDIPEDLLRRAKSTAALRGIKLKDLVASLLEAGLRTEQSQPQVVRETGQKRAIPVSISSCGEVPALSNLELAEIFLKDDLQNLALG